MENSNLGLEDLTLDWDGVDQCRNLSLGALRLHAYMLRNLASEIEGDEAERVRFIGWMLEDQIDKTDSFLGRLCTAMRNNIGSEGRSLTGK